MPSWGAGFNTEKNRYLLVQRRVTGSDVYALVYVIDDDNSNPIVAYQEIVEIKPMEGGQVTVLDASAMKRGLETEGRVAVYGIYFDMAKSHIKPTSKPSLDEMANLLNSNPAFRVYIVGHTDNIGTPATNLDLSQRRADAGVNALVNSYKVNRLHPCHPTLTRPVALTIAEWSWSFSNLWRRSRSLRIQRFFSLE